MDLEADKAFHGALLFVVVNHLNRGISIKFVRYVIAATGNRVFIPVLLFIIAGLNKLCLVSRDAVFVYIGVLHKTPVLDAGVAVFDSKLDLQHEILEQPLIFAAAVDDSSGLIPPMFDWPERINKCFPSTPSR